MQPVPTEVPSQRSPRKVMTNVRPVHVRVAGSADAGQRIDNYLLRVLKGVPRTRIYQMVRRGEVRVNGARVKPTTRLSEGDAVRVPPVQLPEAHRAAAGGERLASVLEAAVLFEDDELLALNKPAGVAVHGGSGVAAAVVETLRAHRAAPEYELVHRLDRETSGCLLLAKRRGALRKAQQLLRERAVHKRYVAIVHGRWRRGALRIDLPLHRSLRGAERVVRVDVHGVEAVTEVESVRLVGDLSVLTLRLVTGRTHQIRVHLAHLGHPIMGDAKYGTATLDEAHWALGWQPRLYLHASHLALGTLSVNAPLPEAFRRVEGP